jgi:hypothetical protein
MHSISKDVKLLTAVLHKTGDLRLHQPGECLTRVYITLFVQIFQMSFYGSLTDTQLTRYLFSAFPFEQPLNYFALS